MKFNKILTILTILIASAFLLAGCTNNNNIKNNDNIKVETDENIGTGSTSDNDMSSVQTAQIEADFNDNSIDAEIELGELI